MNRIDPLEEELRTLMEPVTPELKARIAKELKEPAPIVDATNTRAASLLAAGVMMALAVGLFAMVRPNRPAMEATGPKASQESAKRMPAADGGNENAPPPRPDDKDPHTQPKDAAVSDEERLLDQRRKAAQKEADEARQRETRLFQERIAKLLEQTEKLYEQLDYKGAELLAVQLLKMDPFNHEAEELKEKARKQLLAQAQDAEHLEKRQQEDIEKLKSVILKQQTTLVIERENAERARAEKKAMEEELNATKQTLATHTEELKFPSPESVVRAEIDAQASAHLDAGKLHFNAFQYEDARKEFELAMQLNGKSEESKTWLTRTNNVLGERRDRIKAAVAQLSSGQKVSVQEKLVELDNRIDWGKRYLSQAQADPDLPLADRIRKYQKAQLTFEQARELIKYMPVEVNVEAQNTEVNRLLTETGKAIAAAEARLQETDRETSAQLAAEQTASERRFFEKKVNKMVDEASALFEAGQFVKATALAKEILEIDPSNAEAHSIIATARERAHADKRKLVDQEYKEQFELNREHAGDAGIPHRDYLIYGDNWKEIVKKAATELHAAPEEAWKTEARKKLQKKVSFDFTEQSLADAVDFLNTKCGANVVIDPKAKEEKGADKTPVTLRVNDMELELALKWIAKIADVEFEIRENGVAFTVKKSEEIEAPELRIYDVADLIKAVPDFSGTPNIQLQAENGHSTKKLAELIRTRVRPDQWDPEKTSIEEMAGRLVIMQRPKIHALIHQLLTQLRDTAKTTINIEARFFTSDSGKTLLKKLKKKPGDTVTAEELKPIQDVDSLATPRLTVFNGQRASVAVEQTTAYVADYDQKTHEKISKELKPGVHLNATPIISSDRKYVTLELNPSATELVRMDKKKTEKGEIEIPVLRVHEAKTTVTIPDQPKLMIIEIPETQAVGEKSGSLYLLIGARIVELKDEEKL